MLAASLLSGVILALAASGAPADPERAGSLALGEIAAGLSRGLRSTWERGLQGDGPGPPAGHVFRWREEPGPEPSPVEAGPGDAAAIAFDIDLLRADRAELLEDDLEGARGWIGTALDRPGIGPARRGAAWLRGIQLALRADDAEEARAYHRAASLELGGLEAQEGISLRLLIGLAIAPALEAEERAALGEELARGWTNEVLVLPGPGASLAREGAEVHPRESPEVDALRGALEELSGASLPPVGEARAVRALRQALGALPTPAQGGAWTVEATPLGLLAASRREGRSEAYFLDPGLCAEALASRAREDGVLRGDFQVEPSRTGGEASVVAGGIPLVGNAFSVDLRHPDPASLVATERARAARTRLALLAAAVVLAVAGGATYRAIRRERLLQELRTSFVASVSHELRTPLASILLMAENLQEGRVEGSESAHRYHGLIRSEALRLRRLIEDVLDFSRLERGVKPRLVREELELADWLDELERGWERGAQRLGGRVRLSRSALPATAALDGDALRRALDNLVENGLQHGGGAVEVTARAVESELSFEVRDRGPGIPPSRTERVFEAFVRLEDGDRAPTTGAGLGLAIVREIAEAHRGGVRVARPGDGPGALLILTVPLEEPDE